MSKTLPNKEEKKFFLTAEEKANLQGRKQVVKYLLSVINDDINRLLGEVVYPRLALKPETTVELSEDASFITVKEKSNLIIPNQELIVPKEVKKI